MSLGKVNCCLKPLVEQGLVEANNCKNKKKTAVNPYVFTRKGINAKTESSIRCLARKMARHETLKKMTDQLDSDLTGDTTGATPPRVSSASMR